MKLFGHGPQVKIKKNMFPIFKFAHDSVTPLLKSLNDIVSNMKVNDIRSSLSAYDESICVSFEILDTFGYFVCLLVSKYSNPIVSINP